MSFRSLLNRTVNVRGRTKSSDGLGGYTVTSTVAYTSVPAAIQPLSGTERGMYRSEKIEVTDQMWFEKSYSVSEDDEIVDSNGAVYDVEFVEDEAGRSHHNRALLRRMKPAV